MTEETWADCDDIELMTKGVGVLLSEQIRRFRLLAVACCRELSRWVEDEPLWDVLAAAERYADGLLKDGGLARWTAIANKSWRAAAQEPRTNGHDARIATHRAIAYSTLTGRHDFVGNIPSRILGDKAAFGAVAHRRLRERFPHLLRDIFGNPFRPVMFNSKWRTEHAVGLAAKMYDDRDFRAMPILADALEEAGCDSADILAHCREPGVHVRGCWVVDLVLGKG